MQPRNRTEQLGLVDVCRKVLMALNGISAVVSGGLLCTGLFFKFKKTVLKDLFISMSAKVRSYTETADGTDINNFNFDSLLETVVTAIIVVGAAALCLSLLGTVAVKQKLLVLCLLYTIILFALLLSHVAMIVVGGVKRNVIDELIKPGLTSGISEGYRGYNETDEISQAWTFVMVTLSCCGVDGYQDFSTASHWNRKVFQEGWWFNLAAPVSCCKMHLKQADDFSCAVNPSVSTSNYQTGCYDAAISSVDKYSGYLWTGLALILLIQITSFLSAGIFTKQLYHRRKYTGNNDNNIVYSPEEQINNKYAQLIALCNGAPNYRRKQEQHRDSRRAMSDFDGISHNPRINMNSQYSDAFHRLFSGLNPNQYMSQYGISALLNATHGMQAPAGLPDMMFTSYSAPTNSPMTYDPIYEMSSQVSTAKSHNERALAPYARRNPGSFTIGFPAISNASHAKTMRYQTETLEDQSYIREIPDNRAVPLVKRNTPPMLSRAALKASIGMATTVRTHDNRTKTIISNGPCQPTAGQHLTLIANDSFANLERSRAGTL